jgi:hypothetical protein
MTTGLHEKELGATLPDDTGLTTDTLLLLGVQAIELGFHDIV